MIGDDFASVLARARARRGDGIERIYRDLAPVVRGYLRVNGARDPDDLTGDVFVDVLRGLDGFTGDERHFRSWVLTITHRRLIDDFRRRGRRPESLMPPEDLRDAVIDLSSSEEEAISHVRSRGTLEIMGRLTEDQRAVLFLRVIADMSVLDVAATLGKAETAVKALQRRALVRMRQLLDEERGDGSE